MKTSLSSDSVVSFELENLILFTTAFFFCLSALFFCPASSHVFIISSKKKTSERAFMRQCTFTLLRSKTASIYANCKVTLEINRR